MSDKKPKKATTPKAKKPVAEKPEAAVVAPRVLAPTPMSQGEALEVAMRQVHEEGAIIPEPQTMAAMNAADSRPPDTTPEGLLRPIAENIVIASGGGLEEDGRRARHRAKLKAEEINRCPRVMVVVPMTDSEKQRVRPGDIRTNPLKTVRIDGYEWNIRKGVPTLVPQPIFDILYQRGHLGA